LTRAGVAAVPNDSSQPALDRVDWRSDDKKRDVDKLGDAS
jgi:hypothetical protein